MRRPLNAALGAEDRSLARRWVIGSASVYWTIAIVIIAALLTGSGADRVKIADASGQRGLLQGQSGTLPYGSLPNMVQSIPACTASQACMAVKTSDLGKQK
jgi:hypothetical protein